MANPPESSFPEGGPCPLPPDLQSASVDQLIEFLRDPKFREVALFFLVKKREQAGDLALLLWNSSDTIYILLMEIMATYKLPTSSKLTQGHSTHVCNALVLLQCVASHPETRMPFINAKIPVYLYPFLDTTAVETPFEFLRLASLAVIGGLLKVDDPQVVHFLLDTGIFPGILRCMEFGCIQSKSVATLVVLKILSQEEGMRYCCDFSERVYAVLWVLGGMVNCIDLAEQPSMKLINLVLHCYFRLSEVPRACGTLRNCFPPRLGDPTFISVIDEEDPTTMAYLRHVRYKLKILQT